MVCGKIEGIFSEGGTSMKKYVADLLLLSVAFVWGTTFVVAQNAVSVLEPFTFNGLRFLCAAGFLLLWIVCFSRKPFKTINRSLIGSGVILGIFLFSGYALQTFGLLYTTSSKAGFLTGLSVVLVPLLGFIIFKQKPRVSAIVGVAIAAVGLYMMTTGDRSSVNLGDLLEFLCAFAFGLHIVFTGKYASRFPAILLTFVQISTVGVLNFVSAFLFEDWQKAFTSTAAESGVWTAILFTSLVATVLAYLAQTAMQKYSPPTRVALILTMEPVFAAATAYIWTGERLGGAALIGCLLIFAGMILAELPGKVFSRFKHSEKHSISG